ncbi:aminotransferase class-III [Segniliparus rotundus DSM 44985]|uniref:Aminotransferase class-III n=1 Tax=Segniliparus rotundus (strain ATCC BAA-972 / CDC 1076 / CIP 108378 / DSM 44985 / JCM 13578) TaxID=640132 RepID=D6Z782_SEGRD|nr:aminotransferase class III-fold pyridoxal phosphate-dependent enzyme [Segniliparus rotundus]ADG97812.1 aminotransferase class-III [Segniliparus rotundus DSM 44985]
MTAEHESFLADANAYAEHVRPAVSRVLRACGLDVAYSSAQGDRLCRADDPHAQRPVLDMVGGYGASLFGHNHPRLVAALVQALQGATPVNAQASVRMSSARLAARLSGLVGETTGRSYVVTFGCTGADAVEAAMKHAVAERVRRLDSAQERLERAARWVRREHVGGQRAPGAGGGERWDDVLANSMAAVQALRIAAPSFASLGGAFHGKTAGAAILTETVDAGDGFRVPGPRRVRLDSWSPDEIVRAADSEMRTVVLADFDARGRPSLSEERISTLAACFVEPILGEGGVREVPAAVLRAMRELADRHGAALVFDEIQTGMGRTGAFLASEQSGVAADYYLLAKSLGGGVAKLSAMLVEQHRYVDDFGRYHTSTFADDDLSAVVALTALDLLAGLAPSLPVLADALHADLSQLVERWPTVFAELRGRGLLLGLELRPAQADSPLLRGLVGSDGWGYIVSGYLLERHAVRVLPTLSAPLTLRIEPSAYLNDEDRAQLVGALDETAARLSSRDYAGLLSHLARPPVGRWRPPRRPRRALARSAPRPQGTVRRAAFLANLEGPSTVRLLAPELASWTDAQCAAALDRMLGELKPFEVSRHTVSSPVAGPLEVSVIGVPFSAAQASRLLHAGERPWLSGVVLEAVALAASLGASVVGLGAYTSIVTGSARDIVEDGLLVTSGNSLAAACAWQAVRRFADDRAGSADGIRVAVVGALGNIGEVLAQLLAETADTLVLVGRPGSARRLRRLGDSLSATTCVQVSEDIEVLRGCDVVVTASNSPHPIVQPQHLPPGTPRLVYDLAVPGDVALPVAGLAHVRWYAGGRMCLPMRQRVVFEGTGLAPGVVYACMAETMLLGFEPDAGVASHGPLTADSVRSAACLAARHGFEFVDTRKIGISV